MPSIYDWSLTAASNATADGQINWAEFQDPDTVNNSARQMMARQAAWLDDAATNKLSTGAANVYSVTSVTQPGGATPPDGMRIGFIAHQANLGACSLSVDSYGNRPLRAVTGAALGPGNIQPNMPVTADYRAATNEWIASGTGANVAAYLTSFQSADLTARIMKVGMGFWWFGPALPGGYLYADGSTVSRTTYSELFAAYGTTYGAGDGSTTFHLPDLRGRSPFGKDNMGGTAANRITLAGSGISGTTLGAFGGSETVVLSQGNIPNYTLPDSFSIATAGAHTHSVPMRTSSVAGGSGGASAFVHPTAGFSDGSSSETTDSEPAHTHTLNGSVTSGGSGTPASIMPPTLITNFIILALPSAAAQQVLAKGAITAANGLNSNIALPSQQSVRLSGPTAAFSLGGLAAGVDGQIFNIYNSTAFAMTIVNESVSSTAANRFKTLTGADVTLRTGTSYASFEYDGSDARWILTGTN